MFGKCANPDCSKPFEYGHGRFFRFPSGRSAQGIPANSHGVQHFWLCRRCSKTHTLEYRKESGVAVRLRLALHRQSLIPPLISAA